MVEFLPPLADATDFPSAFNEIRATLAFDLFGSGRDYRRFRDATARPWVATASGHDALSVLGDRLGLSPGDPVLLPAYHCPSMVWPFIAARSEIRFYRVDDALAPDYDDVVRLLDGGTKLALFVKYFGFDQDVARCVAACGERGIAVVHDCAHAFHALDKVPAQDYAIVSCPKFFPVEDGGYLVLPAGADPLPKLPGPGLRSELSQLSKALDRARRARTLRPLSLLGAVPDLLRRGRRDVAAARADPVTAGAAAGACVAPRRVRHSRLTALVLACAAFDRSARRRRHNYATIVRGIAQVPGLRALYPVLPDDVVPYMVPVVLARGNDAFHALRRAGLAMYRWEDFAVTDCAVSLAYRDTLVQIPCHEGLGEGSVRHMLAVLTRVAGQRTP